MCESLSPLGEREGPAEREGEGYFLVLGERTPPYVAARAFSFRPSWISKVSSLTE